MYKIEKGFAVSSFTKGPVYPLDKMEVGDSFELPLAKKGSCAVSATRYGKEHGKKFTIRRNGTKARCWRIK